MPRRSLHRRRRAQGGCLTFLIAVVAVAALALAAAIAITGHFRPRDTALTAQTTLPADGVYVDANNPPAEDHQLVLTANSYSDEPEVDPDYTPTPSPTPSPTPEPTFNPDDPYALVRPRPTEEGFLPVFEKANTDQRRIAITLDECSGSTITKEFALAAHEEGAKLTLFPTGENVMKKGMNEVLKGCLYTLGFEIENRCYSNTARLYMLNDYMMTSEIWKQSIAVSYQLGVKYQPHFLRLYGGDGENDKRTHAFLAQEGYVGIAHWTVNGSASSADRIGQTLEPGAIYYFKTTKADLETMKALMRVAKGDGYEMVTLNELFGYPENEWEDVGGNILSETMPELRDFDNVTDLYFFKSGDCTWAANLLQRRLVELGYLPEGSADGVFGSGTAAALSAFQARCGLAATGAADVETQKRLYAEDAPVNS